MPKVSDFFEWQAHPMLLRRGLSGKTLVLLFIDAVSLPGRSVCLENTGPVG
jgi:hypothetical protein